MKNMEADELALIGGIISNMHLLPEVVQVLPNANYLVTPTAQQIYFALTEFNRRGEPTTNPTLVMNELYRINISDEAKMAKKNVICSENEYDRNIVSFMRQWNERYGANADNLLELASVIKWFSHDALVIYNSASDIADSVFDVPYTDRDSFIDLLQARFGQISIDMREDSDLKLLRDTTDDIEDEFSKMEEWLPIDDSIQTGLEAFDDLLGNMNAGEVIVVAATPGGGKTALAMTIAENVASGIGIPGHTRHSVMIFSLEMMEKQLLYRLIAKTARVNTEGLLRDYRRITQIDEKTLTGSALEEYECRKNSVMDRLERMKLALSYVKTLPIYQDTASNMNVNVMRTLVKQKQEEIRANGEPPLGLIIVDYLQIMTPTEVGGNMSRNDIVGAMSRKIKQIAKDAHVPVMLLSQLNRQAGQDQRPSLSNLRESGSIEQDADKVVFLYSPNALKEKRDYQSDYTDERAQGLALDRDRMRVNMYVAKNRQGRMGEVEAIFDKQFQNFATQSISYTSTERFDEFFNKYYTKTRSGEDLFWPLKEDDIPESLLRYRTQGIVENMYLDQSGQVILPTLIDVPKATVRQVKRNDAAAAKRTGSDSDASNKVTSKDSVNEAPRNEARNAHSERMDTVSESRHDDAARTYDMPDAADATVPSYDEVPVYDDEFASYNEYGSTGWDASYDEYYAEYGFDDEHYDVSEYDDGEISVSDIESELSGGDGSDGMFDAESDASDALDDAVSELDDADEESYESDDDDDYDAIMDRLNNGAEKMRHHRNS